MNSLTAKKMYNREKRRGEDQTGGILSPEPVKSYLRTDNGALEIHSLRNLETVHENAEERSDYVNHGE